MRETHRHHGLPILNFIAFQQFACLEYFLRQVPFTVAKRSTHAEYTWMCRFRSSTAPGVNSSPDPGNLLGTLVRVSVSERHGRRLVKLAKFGRMRSQNLGKKIQTTLLYLPQVVEVVVKMALGGNGCQRSQFWPMNKPYRPGK